MKGLRVKVLVVSVALVTALTIGLASSSATTATSAKATKAAPAAKHHEMRLITTKQIANGAITTAKLAKHAVTSAKIRNGAVTASKIKNNAVTTSKIRDGAVTTSKIGDGAVTTSKIGDGAVGSAQLSSALLTQLAGYLVRNPSATQTITYGGKTVGTVLKMASGATANPFEIQDSTGNDVYAIGPDGSFFALGPFSTDAGQISSDGAGDLNIDGAFSSDGADISTDGVGDLTVGGQFTSDGGAVATDGFGDLTITGQLSTDSGAVTTSGAGDLTISGALSTDNGDISSDGSGNLTVNGDLTGFGAIDAEGNDPQGNALNVDGGGLVVTGTNNDGNYVDIGSGSAVVDGAGNLTIAGNLTAVGGTFSDLVTAQNGLLVTGGLSTDNLKVSGADTFTSTPAALAATATITASDMVIAKILTVTGGGGSLTTDTAANIVAAIPNAAVGDTFKFLIANNSASAEFLSPGAGVTFDNVGSLPGSSNAELECVVTATGTPGVTCFESGRSVVGP
jgi:trimeric autotransporter adhesin